jgi:hypothetical protein
LKKPLIDAAEGQQPSASSVHGSTGTHQLPMGPPPLLHSLAQEQAQGHHSTAAATGRKRVLEEGNFGWFAIWYKKNTPK